MSERSKGHAHPPEGPDVCPHLKRGAFSLEPLQGRDENGDGCWRGLKLPLGITRQDGLLYRAVRDPLQPERLAVLRQKFDGGQGDQGFRYVAVVDYEVPAGHLLALDSRGDVLILPIRGRPQAHAAGTIRPFNDEEMRAWKDALQVDAAADQACRALGFRPLGELKTAWREPKPPTRGEWTKAAALVGETLPQEYLAFTAAINGGSPWLGRIESPEADVSGFLVAGSAFQEGVAEQILGLRNQRVLPVAVCANGDRLVMRCAGGDWQVDLWNHETTKFESVSGSLVALINMLTREGEDR